MRLFSMLSLLIVAASRIAAQGPSAAELTEVTQRGRNLAAYDVAISGARDALSRRVPPPGSVTRYAVRRTDRGFVVRFGHLSVARDTFFVTYEATQRNGPDDFGVDTFLPAHVGDESDRIDVMAVETTERALGKRARPFRAIVMPAPNNEHWVYWVPEQTRVGIWPLGDDVRYRVRSDGARIVDRRVLHRELLETVLPIGTEYGSHSSSTDRPEDSDVMYVLRRRPAVPEIVAAGGRYYYITLDGTIAVNDR
ncbi:MAG: hypothetical protein M3081_18080 [Gemmatimonadota bacterium]|nr:hypothetical protein [Gemmatimonadota bacterium]